MPQADVGDEIDLGYQHQSPKSFRRLGNPESGGGWMDNQFLDSLQIRKQDLFGEVSDFLGSDRISIVAFDEEECGLQLA